MSDVIPDIDKKLTELEITKLELHHMKFENLKMQSERLNNDLQRCRELLSASAKEAREYQAGIAQKYGIDLKSSKIMPDGTIVHAPSQEELGTGRITP